MNKANLTTEIRIKIIILIMLKNIFFLPGFSSFTSSSSAKTNL